MNADQTPATINSDNPSAQSENTISGAVDFTAKETQTITIDGVEYTVTNDSNSSNSLSWTKDTTTGQLSFYCSNVTIVAQKDVAHDLKIEGLAVNLTTGDLADRVEYIGEQVGALGSIYLGAGDDTFSSENNSGYTAYIYGEDGNDEITVRYSSFVYGGNGNDTLTVAGIGSNENKLYGEEGGDTIYIKSGSSNKAYGDSGDDDFYISSSATKTLADGGEGTNTIDDLGTNTTRINFPNANYYALTLSANQTQTILINNISYEIKNNTSSDNTLTYTVENGKVIFNSGEKFSVKGQDGIDHNVVFRLNYSTFYGGDGNDTIAVEGSLNAIWGYGGNDSIETVYALGLINSIYGGDGNDTITDNSSYNNIFGQGDDDTIILNNSGEYPGLVQGGDGNDTFYLNEKNLTVDGGSGNDEFHVASGVENSFITGGAGTNNIYDNGTNTFFSDISNASDNSTSILLGAGATQEITIGGIKYTITNSTSDVRSLIYNYNAVTGKVTFSGNKLTIRGESDVSHNIDLYGKEIYLYTGSKSDTVYDYGYNNHVYAGDGDDILYAYGVGNDTRVYGEGGNDTIIAGRGGYVYGGDGDDEITINSATVNGAYGDDGNDVFNINANNRLVSDTSGNNVFNIKANNCSVSAGSGNDTFYIDGNNNTILGAGGNDYLVNNGDSNLLDGGTGINYVMDNGTNSTIQNAVVDPNSGIINFSYVNQKETFTIGGRTYTVTNQNEDGTAPASNSLKYYYNPQTGELILEGSNLTIESETDKTHNFVIKGDNNLISGGDLNDRINIQEGNGNTIYAGSGNDTIISNGNNAIYGESGDDRITQNGSNGSTIISSGDGNDTLLINSDNNTNIQTGSGNNTTTITGSNNNLTTENGNNKITTNGNNNTITTGNGDNRFSIVGNENQITTGEGNKIIGIQGNNNTLTGQDGNNTINIIGGNNTITTGNGNTNTNVRGNENNLEYGTGEAEIKITGDDNTSKIQDGNKNIEIDGNNNSLTSGSGTGNIEINGNENEFETVDGNTEVDVKGDGNTINTGAGIDKIEIKGDNNIATSGEGDDEFQINKGDGNTIDGNEGYNTMINGGTNTKYTNVVDITPKPLNIRLQVGANSTDGINIKLEFNMFGFELDFGSAENAAENIEQIEEVLSEINTQRAQIGAMMNRLESASARNTTSIENLTSSRSTIMDADIAAESAAYVKNQILQQTSTSLLSSTQNLRRSLILNLLQ